MHVVICGGGIIGCSVAYHLAKRGVKSTIVEGTGIACAASGKAGGFLAKDWCDGTPVGPLAQLSYKLHMEQSQTFTDCDYRKMDALAVTAREDYRGRRQGPIPDWTDKEVDQASVMGTTDNTAQVHPYKLCHAYLNKAQEMVGTDVKIAKVTGIRSEGDKKVSGVELDNGEVIQADVVVIAMGPWTMHATKWCSIPKVFNWRAASVIFKPDSPVTATALFVDYFPKSGPSQVMEWYPRPDNTVYICSGDEKEKRLSGADDLPENPNDAQPSKATVEKICHTAAKMSSVVGGKVEKHQACYLPGVEDETPCIGKIPGLEGGYVATGHGVWGILNSPGTGLALAELIVEGKSTVLDLKPFDPARLL